MTYSKLQKAIFEAAQDDARYLQAEIERERYEQDLRDAYPFEDQRREDEDFEINARYDDVRERFAGEELDPCVESGFCSAGCRHLPRGFVQTAAGEVVFVRPTVAALADDEIPF